jgi:hypothetical protein
LSNGGLVIEETLILRVKRTDLRDYRATPALFPWGFTRSRHKLSFIGNAKTMEWR